MRKGESLAFIMEDCSELVVLKLTAKGEQELGVQRVGRDSSRKMK